MNPHARSLSILLPVFAFAAPAAAQRILYEFEGPNPKELYGSALSVLPKGA